MLDNLKQASVKYKKPVVISLILLAILIVIAAGYYYYFRPNTEESVTYEDVEEGFDNTLIEEEFEDMDKVPVLTTEEGNVYGPLINPENSSIMDGPGFEAGPIEGISGDEFSLIPSNYYFLDDGENGQQSIQHNLCSKSCCSSQYPTPHKLKHDPFVCANKDEFVPTNTMCNNTFQDSGCLCMTKKQANFIRSRGGNGVNM